MIRGVFIAAVYIRAAVCLGISVTLLVTSHAHAQTCAADCDGNNAVGIEELVTCVGRFLGTVGDDICAPCDIDANGAVNVNDLVEGVNVALGDFVVIPAVGQCLRPCPDRPCTDSRVRDNGLVPCGIGAIRVTRCDSLGHCTQAGV